jgi:hypothetical protein
MMVEIFFVVLIFQKKKNLWFANPNQKKKIVYFWFANPKRLGSQNIHSLPFFVLCSLFFVLCSLFFVLCSLFFVLCSSSLPVKIGSTKFYTFYCQYCELPCFVLENSLSLSQKHDILPFAHWRDVKKSSLLFVGSCEIERELAPPDESLTTPSLHWWSAYPTLQ